jgi:methyl-accepting chemotaxis protein
MADYEKLISSDEERKTYEDAKVGIEDYIKGSNQIFSLVDADNFDDARNISLITAYKKFGSVEGNLKKLVEINQEGAKEAYASALSTYRMTMGIMIAMTVVAILLVAGISYTIIVGIDGGISELRRAFTALSNLDLRLRGNVRGKDEISETLGAYNTTVDKLTMVVRTTQEAAASVSAASAELSTGMHSIASVASQQETELNQIAAALEETSSTAAEVNHKSTQSGEATERVANEIQTVMGTVSELRKSAQEIGSARDVIQEISEQINLLSLNAAIEAARAGDAGRGFAVVADEVRKLATSTSNSTGEIAKMVAQLQNIVDRTSAALESVNSLLDGVRANSRGVVNAVSEQTQAVGDIARNISEFRDQMSSVIHNVRESQNAAESLSSAAEELNHQTVQFKV